MFYGATILMVVFDGALVSPKFFVSPKSGAGAGVGVGMLRGAGITLLEHKNVSRVLGFLVS